MKLLYISQLEQDFDSTRLLLFSHHHYQQKKKYSVQMQSPSAPKYFLKKFFKNCHLLNQICFVNL